MGSKALGFTEVIGLPTKELTAVDGTVAHLQDAAGYQLRQDTQLQQDTHMIHSSNRIQQQQDTRLQPDTTGYVAGLQDTQLISRICGWTTGYTAKQQDTWTHHGSSILQQQE